MTKANEAKEKTERANIIEQAQLDILGVQVGSNGEITESELKAILEPKYGTISGEGENQILTTKEGQEIKVSEIYDGIFAIEPLANRVEVGDYIKYGEKLTAKTYTTDTNETGHSTSQNFTTNTSMLWRVMSKKANGDVEIVAVSNGLASDGTTGLYLYGETGFVNAETVLKNLCSTLYTSSYGEARNINVDDINALTGFNPETSDWEDKDYYLNNRSKTYTSGKIWDKASNTFKVATTANPVTVEHTRYLYTVAETMPLYDTLIQESTTYTGDYSETNYPLSYWLGSRYVRARDNYVTFGVRTVDGGMVDYYYLLGANTDGSFSEGNYACGVRPVVTLKSNIQIEETTATGGVTTWTIK